MNTEQDNSSERHITFWEVLVALITDPGSRAAFREGWKRGTTMWETEQMAHRTRSSSRTNHDEEFLSEFHFRPEDFWDTSSNADFVGDYTDMDVPPVFEEESFPVGIDYPESKDCMAVEYRPNEDEYFDGLHYFCSSCEEEPASICDSKDIIEIFPYPQASLEDLWKISPEEEETSGSYFQYNFISQDVHGSEHRRCLM